MKSRNLWTAAILMLAAATLVTGCESPRGAAYPVTPTYYYVTPATTFLRDCPGYECSIVMEVYSGDRVAVLDRNDFGWSRVQLDRTGAIGWIPGDLLSLSPIPPNFYVAYSTVYLRDCADYNCRAVELMNRGDRVEKLDQDYRGWWRVRSYKTGNSGWVPASAVSVRPGPPYFYVDVSSLALRAGPSTSSRILTTLSLNSQVEMLGSGVGGWVQVRDVRSGIIGWVAARYLESFPVPYARSAPKKKRAPAKKGAPAEEEEEAPKEAPKPGPKAM
jgi:uncharacterized protein YgiM (DUF1202 family)